jgi:hypothetical protein
VAAKGAGGFWGQPYDAAVSLAAADAEAELVALRPPPATFERWIKPISSYGLRKDSTGVMRFG